jgi:Icc-related predicted phosphoesterase
LNTTCIFVSDLHGKEDRYHKLFALIREQTPDYVFIGGDLLPWAIMKLQTPAAVQSNFLSGFIEQELRRLRDQLNAKYPEIFVILGNDDGRLAEKSALEIEDLKLWHYVHNRKSCVGEYSVYGYAYVPPTPFRLKDWERYDVSRFVDPGCTSPEEGIRTISVSEHESDWSTIAEDLESLAAEDDLAKSILLFHSPPYQTNLDRAALDGQIVDHVPLDLHVGSIAIQRFIQTRQPLLTLHGHIHESARLMGSWRDKIGRTHCLNAAHDGQELAVITFSLDDPENAQRVLI